MSNLDETLGVVDAAGLLRAETSTVMQLARSGALPGTRIGKSWVFLREDVIAFLRQQIVTDTAERRRAAAKGAVALAVSIRRASRRTKLPILPALPAIHEPEKAP